MDFLAKLHQQPYCKQIPAARAGGSHILANAHTAEQQRQSPLIGTPDEIVAKLQTLWAAGVEYVMLNAAGSRSNLRRFAREVMPHVAAQPSRVTAAC